MRQLQAAGEGGVVLEGEVRAGGVRADEERHAVAGRCQGYIPLWRGDVERLGEKGAGGAFGDAAGILVEQQRARVGAVAGVRGENGAGLERAEDGEVATVAINGECAGQIRAVAGFDAGIGRDGEAGIVHQFDGAGGAGRQEAPALQRQSGKRADAVWAVQNGTVEGGARGFEAAGLEGERAGF